MIALQRPEMSGQPTSAGLAGLVRINRKLKKIEASGLTELEASGRITVRTFGPTVQTSGPTSCYGSRVNLEWLPAIGGGDHDGFRSYQGILAQRPSGSKQTSKLR
jgi:hypothetical protein